MWLWYPEGRRVLSFAVKAGQDVARFCSYRVWSGLHVYQTANELDFHPLYQVSDFIVIFCLILWTKGRENVTVLQSSSHKNVVQQERKSFFIIELKASLLIWIKGVSYLPVISSESISSQPCHPPIRGEQTKRSGMRWHLKTFFPGRKWRDFSLSAVTWLMWSLFFKIKSPPLPMMSLV